MGNYYEGNIKLYLKKDTPLDVIKTLLSIPDDCNKSMYYISNKFVGKEIFEKGKYKPSIEVYAVTDNDCFILDLDNLEKNNQELFYINLNFICKTDRDEFYTNMADKWFNTFKEYIDIDYIKDIKNKENISDNCFELGKAYDEDGYYNSLFILYKNELRTVSITEDDCFNYNINTDRYYIMSDFINEIINEISSIDEKWITIEVNEKYYCIYKDKQVVFNTMPDDLQDKFIKKAIAYEGCSNYSIYTE